MILGAWTLTLTLEALAALIVENACRVLERNLGYGSSFRLV